MKDLTNSRKYDDFFTLDMLCGAIHVTDNWQILPMR